MGMFFFFQAEDGIRDLTVTGVQTCALPILHGFGPFARESQNTSLLLLQAFIGVMAVTSMALAAEISEHQRADEYVRQLAVTDPLTGLANYRRLLDALDSEIKRYERTGRPFAVVLLDLDKLKMINDTHGHLVGTAAICRLANILRIHCRAMDTAARYGGRSEERR